VVPLGTAHVALSKRMFRFNQCVFSIVLNFGGVSVDGALLKGIGSLSEDAIGYALERRDPSAVFRSGL